MNQIDLVAIGASAGGLEPLQEFFDAVPDDTGMSFLVVQHLSPDHPSLMHELLSRHTAMPVHRVADGMAIEPNCVYLITPSTYMRVESGHLKVTEQHRTRESPPTPIDVVFESVAESYGNRCAAIVLSGTGTDGSRGIKAVQEAGGYTIVQDETSKFDGMPRAAIASGLVDMVVPASDMPRVLLGQDRDPDLPPSSPTVSADMLLVLDVLSDRHGLNFSQYKIATVQRRIERRVQMTNCSCVAEYHGKVKEDSEEQDALYRDLLIGVTRFFRDAEAFEIMEQTVIPSLFESLEPDSEGLRVWDVGCSSGEEAYSLAMLLHEAARKHGKPVSIKVFATDAHAGSIEFAAAGVYEADLVKGIPERFLDEHFTRTGDKYQINPSLRGMITFAPHNVLADAPFTRIDLVVCRNMLIYFKPNAQRKVMGLLHFALRVGGTMMLGSSETLGHFQDEFEAVDKHWRVYRKLRNSRLLVEGDISSLTPRMELHNRALTPAPIHTVSDSRLQRAYDLILGDLMSAGFLLNERRELLHCFGGAEELLRAPAGRASLDLLDMVPNELRIAAGSAIVRAVRAKTAFRYDNIKIEMGGEMRPRYIEAMPLDTTPGRPPYMLIKIGNYDPEPGQSVSVNERLLSAEFTPDELSAQKIEVLEGELQFTKENLQASLEEMETTNEELNATNEELIASNEELQSTNEELQSVNEELHTVNAEHQQKILELTELKDDMTNLMASTNIGTLFLDNDLLIRSFTPALQDHLLLREYDIGRPIGEVKSRLAECDIEEAAREILRVGEPMEFETTGAQYKHLLISLSPYKTQRGTLDGVVISIVDMQTVKQAEAAARHLAQQNQMILDHIPAMVWYKDLNSAIVRSNKAAAQTVDMTPEMVAGQTTEALYPEHAEKYVKDDQQVIRSGKPRLGVVEPLQPKDGPLIWIKTDKVPLRDEDGKVNGLLVVSSDITHLKQTQADLEDSKNILDLSLLATRQGIWDWNPETRSIEVDDRWYEVLGYEPKEFAVSSEDDWFDLIHPDDHPACKKAMKAALAPDGDGKLDINYQIRHKDGDYRWIRSFGCVMAKNEAGQATQVIGTITNIDQSTRQREQLQQLTADLESQVTTRTKELEGARSRLERVIEGTLKGVWEWDVGTDVCWSSSFFWNLLGYNGENQPEDTWQNIYDHIHPDDAPEILIELNRIAKTGENTSREVLLRMQDGEYRWFRLRAVGGSDPVDDRTIVSGSIIDVHKEYLIEQDLNQAKIELEARVVTRTQQLTDTVNTLSIRNDQLDEFAHIAAHDLRAPLLTISGLANFGLSTEDVSDELRNDLESIVNVSKNMSQVIDAISTYSKVSRSEFSMSEVDLDMLLVQVIQSMEAEIQASGAEVTGQELGVVCSDAGLIKQVLMNLVANAIKFVEPGTSPCVKILSESREKEVLLRVLDNGIGIDPQLSKRIFEPFVRLNTPSKYPGSGIGLSLCRRILERQGGEIWVEPRPDGGSAFTLSLPKDPASVD